MARAFVAASSQYLNRSDTPISGGSWTLSAWIRPTALNDNVVLMIGAGAADPRAYLAVNSAGPGTIGVVQDDGPTTATVSTSATATTGTWQHVAGVFGLTARAVYLRGGNKASNATALTAHTLTGPLSIGRYDDGASVTGNYFDGSIAEVGVWNVALTDDEIALLGRGYAPSLIRRSALAGYWPLRAGASPEPDYGVRAAYPVTLNNAPAFTAHPPGIIYGDTPMRGRRRR